ncbi:HAD hydrolase-like protein, partial [Clavibacter michiganensis]|uniref:HAD hydrolase-like protein n=1 Tax=Clavibacter michiganensis TaxID=28447 RepID=UPI00374D68DB
MLPVSDAAACTTRVPARESGAGSGTPAGADPAAALMVGDRLRTDALGGVDAGLAGGQGS